jgi:predicted nucleic acid-binding Zn ribbon protein
MMNEQEKQQKRKMMLLGFLILDTIVVALVLYFVFR